MEDPEDASQWRSWQGQCLLQFIKHNNQSGLVMARL
jgi:hypothetical protein